MSNTNTTTTTTTTTTNLASTERPAAVTWFEVHTAGDACSLLFDLHYPGDA